MTVIFAQKFSWRIREGNRGCSLKPLICHTSSHSPAVGERRGGLIDSQQSLPAFKWLFLSEDTDHSEVVPLPSAIYPRAVNTNPVIKSFFMGFGVIHSNLIHSDLFLAKESCFFFCPFLGIPCNNRTFKCGNDICFRKQNAKCDGTVDCPDGSDEEGCSE